MLKEVLSLSALIVAVLLVRAMFKNRVPKRMIYCLWLVVLLKLCLPGTLFSLPVLPAEKLVALTQISEVPAQTTPVIQQPAQTVMQPQTSAQQQVSPVQETAKPAAKPLTTAQILQIAWFSGSALLGLWLFGAWAVFTIRLHRDRRFLGKRGGTRIYVSGAVKSPCLAGLIPAVYLTEDVLRNDTTELIVRHELTHLHHLDFLWSLCRTIAVIVYWWNPLIWLAAICSKHDAELACDEAVAAKLPERERLAYARAILAQAPRKASALSLAGPPVKERILFLTKKQRTSVLCVVLALLLVVSATGCSFAELTRQKAEEITMPEQPENGISETAPAPEQAQKDGFLRDAALRAKFTPDAAQVPDDEIVGFFRAAEGVLADKQGLEFVTLDGFSPENFFLLFLAWTNEDTLRSCQNPADKLFYFSEAAICRTLDCYFKDYRFDITRCESYDAQSGMVVVPTVSVDGGALDMRFYGKKQNGDMVTYAVDFYTAEGNGASERLSHRKEYTLQCYDGGFYLLSANGVNTPDRIGEIGGICLWDAWDMLPKTLTEGFTDLGVVGVSRENYDVVMYGRNGLYVHVLRLQDGKEDTERGLGDRVCGIYTTSPDYPTQRGLRVGDPESRAIELYGEDYLWDTFGYEQQDGVITRIGFFTYYDAWGTDAVIAPPPVDYLPEN